jgi:hypothetical protein
VAADFGVAVMGLGEPRVFPAWFDRQRQFGIVGPGCRKAEHGDQPCAECEAARREFCAVAWRPPTLSTGAAAAAATRTDSTGYCRLYDRHWRGPSDRTEPIAHRTTSCRCDGLLPAVRSDGVVRSSAGEEYPDRGRGRGGAGASALGPRGHALDGGAVAGLLRGWRGGGLRHLVSAVFSARW